MIVVFTVFCSRRFGLGRSLTLPVAQHDVEAVQSHRRMWNLPQ